MDMAFDGLSALRFWGISLSRCTITPPKRKQSLINILCADASLDLLRGNEPVYEARTITAEFEPTGRNVSHIIDRLEDELEGKRMQITLPNDASFYMVGDVHINSAGVSSGDPIVLTAVCNPWRYRQDATVYSIPQTTASDVELYNSGRKTVVPELIVHSDLTISGSGVAEKQYVAGTYLLPDYQIPGHSSIRVTVKGGPVEIRYQEAML